MNRFERRKLKANIYKHGNTMLYILIFAIASIITMAAATNRTDKILYVDEQSVAGEKESVGINSSSKNKVATMETDTEETQEKEQTGTGIASETEFTSEAVADGETESAAAQSVVTKVKITADTLNVRAKASLEADSIGTVIQGDVYEVISQDGEWIKIQYENNEGYINSQYTETVE